MFWVPDNRRYFEANGCVILRQGAWDDLQSRLAPHPRRNLALLHVRQRPMVNPALASVYAIVRGSRGKERRRHRHVVSR